MHTLTTDQYIADRDARAYFNSVRISRQEVKEENEKKEKGQERKIQNRIWDENYALDFSTLDFTQFVIQVFWI